MEVFSSTWSLDNFIHVATLNNIRVFCQYRFSSAMDKLCMYLASLYFAPHSANILLQLLACFSSYTASTASTLNLHVMEGNITDILLKQKQAVRIIAGARYLDHTVPLFKELNILPIDLLYKATASDFNV